MRFNGNILFLLNTPVSFTIYRKKRFYDEAMQKRKGFHYSFSNTPITESVISQQYRYKALFYLVNESRRVFNRATSFSISISMISLPAGSSSLYRSIIVYSSCEMARGFGESSKSSSVQLKARAIALTVSNCGSRVIPLIILFKVPFGTPDLSDSSSIVIPACFLFCDMSAPISIYISPFMDFSISFSHKCVNKKMPNTEQKHTQTG